MLSIGDLVWYKQERTYKEKGVGMVTKIIEGNYPLYRVRWQKPENFYYSNCYAFQLVKVTSDA